VKNDTQKAFRDPTLEGKRTGKLLRLDAETLRVMTGGSRLPELGSTGRPSQSPTMCY
jgi:hypothetical protein